MGGLSKKSAYIKSVKSLESAAEGACLLLDAGNSLFKEPVLVPAAAEAARVKARGIFAANRRMGFTFAGIGLYDLAAGPEFLRELAGNDFRFLSANLVDRASGESLFPAYTIVRTGELTVAVMALTAPAGTEGQPYLIRPWQEALPKLARQLRSRAHLLILLSNNRLIDNQAIAGACPELDLIFQSGYAMGSLAPLPVGPVLINQTDIRGRVLGRLDIDWQGHGVWQQQDAKPVAGEMSPSRSGFGATRVESTYAQRFITLNHNMPDDPEVGGLVIETERQVQAAGGRTDR